MALASNVSANEVWKSWNDAGSHYRERASAAQSRVDLALDLVSQQEKLLEHALSSADIYLYDLRGAPDFRSDR
jgi:hypothetical protein